MKPSRWVNQALLWAGVAVFACSSAGAAEQVGGRLSMSSTYRAGWIPAFEDGGLCPLPSRAYLETCKPRGRVDLRGPRLRGYVRMPDECARPGDTGGPRWLVISTAVVPPPHAECECAPVGCCQPPPRMAQFAFQVPEIDGILRIDQILPFGAGDQVALQRIEIRASGDCVSATVTDPNSGELTEVEFGPRLAVAGAQVVALPAR